jgi:hypothetical protein
MQRPMKTTIRSRRLTSIQPSKSKQKRARIAEYNTHRTCRPASSQLTPKRPHTSLRKALLQRQPKRRARKSRRRLYLSKSRRLIDPCVPAASFHLPVFERKQRTSLHCSEHCHAHLPRLPRPQPNDEAKPPRRTTKTKQTPPSTRPPNPTR